MKFFLDAQLPFSLLHLFRERKFEASHTEQLPNGNIKNKELILLFEQFLSTIAKEFEDSNWIELSDEGLIIHQD
ncbi:hypothetical protein EHQ27_08180 [Leptospira wolffii]|nr:hypothetical protein EHQ32_09255 [Leptospira wolffii]TGK72426.1 hypothetical protein EHQ27_08180 [Leptospira wolffii]TGK76090.1 hypothetical protein EHQ35_02005 [Leptospira wolffii]TGL30342.1 hypothetical protein EHQ57_07975 [Leptospira wolffii]